MHGKVWMFSHLIDDEDIEFMQHEFISYRQAMDYYNLGYKPIVRLSHKAGAVYKIGKKVLIKRSTFEKYLRENIRREKEEWEKLYQWQTRKAELQKVQALRRIPCSELLPEWYNYLKSLSQCDP